MGAVKWEYHPPLRPPELSPLEAMVNPVSEQFTLAEPDSTGFNRLSRWLTADIVDVVALEEWR